MTKSLYVMSDTHDDHEVVRRAVDYIKSEGRENASIVHAGDLALRPYSVSDLEAVTTGKIDVAGFVDRINNNVSKNLSVYKEILDDSGMDWVVVPGNYDNSLASALPDNDIHNKVVSHNGLRMVGYGGGGNLDEGWIGPGHMHPVVKTGQIQMFNPSELEKLLNDNNPQVAVIHNPPHGLCDDMFNGQHVGTPTTTKYIASGNHDLRLVLSGHIHEAGPNANNPNGIAGVNNVDHANGKRTVVVNPGNLGRFELLNPTTLEHTMQFDYGTFVRVDLEDDGTPTNVSQFSVQDNSRTIGEVKKMRDISL